MEFRDRLLHLRKQKGWSQEELAEQVGVSRQTISKWESGLIEPNWKRMRHLAQIFGVDVMELMDAAPAAQENAPAAPELSPPLRQGAADTPAPPADMANAAPAKPHPKRRILLIGAAVLVVLAAVLVFLLLNRQPNYASTEAVKNFIGQQIADIAPYASYDVSSLTAETVRLQMETKGIEQPIDDEILEQGILLALADFFEAYREYGLVYDVQARMLLYQDQEVGYFEDYNLNGRYQRVSWMGEASLMVWVERDEKGKFLELMVFDE